MVDIDLAFPHSYEIDGIIELPATGKLEVPLHYFPGARTRPERDGLWLKLIPESAEPWVGVFGFGYPSPPAISRVVSTPDKDRVCVVSGGAAYLVKTDDPEIWAELPVVPVLDVRCLPTKQILVFADFTRLTAYDQNGRVWQSPRLCCDGLRILKVTEDRIEGVGYDPTSPQREMPFWADLNTGKSLLRPPISLEGKRLS
ncbi:MAG TPA: hypothetical protein VKR52_01680 [Terracidiphilus sp.]|nr:hypothetical protein [Terracidiphilus sp.]